MKTQIFNLRSGKVNQILNQRSELYAEKSSSGMHAGSPITEVSAAWEAVKSENPCELNILLKIQKGDGFYEKLTLKRVESKSGKTVQFIGTIDSHLLHFFNLDAAKNTQAKIVVNGANDVEIHNGKNAYIAVCPSLIVIL